MASLVFIFVIVAVLFAFRLRQAEESYKKAQAAEEEAKRRADAEQRQLTLANQAVVGAAAARTKLLKKLKEELEAKAKLNVEITDDGLRFQADVLFDVGASQLKPAGRMALKSVANELQQLLPCFVYEKTNPSAACQAPRDYPQGIDAILIEGHTDAQRYTVRNGEAAVDGNWDLSAKRAIAAFRELEPDLGVFQNLKRERVLGVAGYGSSRSTEAADAGPNRPRDRRIEIRILMAAPRVDQDGHGTPQPPP